MSPLARAISEDTPIKLPVKAWLALIAGAAVAGGAWYSLKADVSSHTGQILDLNKDMREQREILIRVDENVKQLRREINSRTVTLHP